MGDLMAAFQHARQGLEADVERASVPCHAYDLPVLAQPLDSSLHAAGN